MELRKLFQVVNLLSFILEVTSANLGLLQGLDRIEKRFVAILFEPILFIITEG
jgi:hypothetical protein